MRILTQIGLVALGSALGGLARWGIGVGCARLLGAMYPWGTLAVNITGSLFLGWFLATQTEEASPGVEMSLKAHNLRLLLAVGFAGAYTTFSTFEWESHAMLRDSRWTGGTLYMIGSLVLGLAAIRAGVLLARM